MKAKLDKISELSNLMSEKESLSTTLISLFSKVRIGNLINHLGMEKRKGVSSSDLILSLCLFRIFGESIHSMYNQRFYGLLDAGKNCFYRFLCRHQMNWRGLLLGVNKSFIQIVKKEQVEETSTPCCYVIDDTTLLKTGFHMEGISRVFDHTKHQCVLGYKLLSLSFFDGRTLIPSDFSLHSEKGKKETYGLNKKQLANRFQKKREEQSYGHKRKHESEVSKIQISIEMMRRAWKKGIKASYALMDSWFVCEEMVREVRKIGKGKVHLLGMAKNGNTKYTYENKRFTAKELVVRKERTCSKSCRKYKCRYIQIDVLLNDLPIRLFLIQYGHKKEWSMLLTTDRTLSFIKAFELYQIRWSTEVMYKECKQYLGLGGCQSLDFDAQIADCTLAFITYTVLALGKRFYEYETMGAIFREKRNELFYLTLWQRILPVIAKLLEQFAYLLNRSLDELLEIVFNDTEAFDKFSVILNAIIDQTTNNQKDNYRIK